MMPLADAIGWAAARLRAAGIENPRREARLLAMHVLQADQASLLLREQEIIETAYFTALVRRREVQEPLAYLTGQKAFWKHDFEVSSATLIPRPETELLVEEAIKFRPDRILDLGTGTGCILLSILSDLPGASGMGTDISREALAVAKRNAQRLGLFDRVCLRESHWLERVEGQFDLAVSNPPYITSAEFLRLDPTVRQFEPRTALTPGTDGLDAYRAITSQLAPHLRPGGHVLFEIGAGQARAVIALLGDAGFEDVRTLCDLAGLDRCVKACWPRA